MKTSITNQIGIIDLVIFSFFALFFSSLVVNAHAFSFHTADSSTKVLTGSSKTYIQQGVKLNGLGSVKEAGLGYSISVSGDGNTAVTGGFSDNDGIGAAWIFTRRNASWVQQGSKLIGTGAVGMAHQGISVAISNDGHTAIVGGFTDNSGIGAAWIYILHEGTWIQQGEKLVGSDFTATPNQGISVSISRDGNTALVGGLHDHINKGAAWVYTRVNGTWTQQGMKLIGSAGSENDLQGCAVSISGDGTTALVGGFGNNSTTGAVWVFARSPLGWVQQGLKLVGTGAGNGGQGLAVSLSNDGNTALVGGYADNHNTGAAWIFSRSRSAWLQQGAKIVGTGAVGAASQGRAVALSANGSTAIIGGYYDSLGAGAAWIFKCHKGSWSQQGSKIVGQGFDRSQQGRSVALSSDGSTAMVGGSGDSSGVGAAWVLTGEGAEADIDSSEDEIASAPLKVTYTPLSRVFSADLASLTTVQLESELSFSPATLDYLVTVENSIIYYTILPLAHDSDARISLNGVLLKKGASGTMSLGIGSNVFHVSVLAADGITKKEYLLTINKLAAPARQQGIQATNILTPNGDGVNDTWLVKDVQNYPRNHVAVYNSAGGLVFAKAGYANEWGGTFKGRVLPEGSYYYVVDLGNGFVFRGFISIMNTFIASSI